VKHVLEPLARIPGIRTAALVTPDGVPIAVHESPRARAPQAEAAPQGEDDQLEQERTCNESFDPSTNLDALAGLAVSWLGSITRSVAPLSWNAPQQLVLRAARGTLMLMQAPGALLIVVLDGGIRHEELRLPMQVAIARMQRHVRDMTAHSAQSASLQPQGIFPSRPNTSDPEALASGAGTDSVHSVGGLGVADVSGE
jgi:predicted regulator of Ras-like GTPase activity (Roadblock/LC7/MglB family)